MDSAQNGLYSCCLADSAENPHLSVCFYHIETHTCNIAVVIQGPIAYDIAGTFFLLLKTGENGNAADLTDLCCVQIATHSYMPLLETSTIACENRTYGLCLTAT